MNILETEYKQRAFDGKWQKLIKIVDIENPYSYMDGKSKITLFSTKWLVANVYDYEIEFVN